MRRQAKKIDLSLFNLKMRRGLKTQDLFEKRMTKYSHVQQMFRSASTSKPYEFSSIFCKIPSFSISLSFAFHFIYFGTFSQYLFTYKRLLL